MTIFPDITKLPDFVTVETENEQKQSFPGAEKIEAEGFALTLREGKVVLRADTAGIAELTLRWRFPMPENTLFCADHWERGYGDMEWRGYVKERAMPWFFFALHEGLFAGFGVKVRPDALCFFNVDKGGVTLTCDVRSGSRCVMPGGKEITCCEIVCREITSGELSERESRFVSLLCAGADAVFPEKPVYGFNNWYYAYGHSSAREIIENAAHLSGLTKDLQNRPFMVIDDGWQKHRRDGDGYIGGSWREGNDLFPDMKKLAGDIAAMDVIPGIWCRPTQNKGEAIKKEWFRDESDFLLDVSVPEVLEFIAQDIDTICEWGYRLIKYDFSTKDITGKWGSCMGDRVCEDDVVFRDGTKTTAMIIKQFYDTVYAATKGRALLLGCNCIGHLGVGKMHLNRTGDDTSGREWNGTRRTGVNTLAFRMPQHGNFYFVDADCAGLTKKVPWDKNKQWLELLAKSGTPLFVSVAPDTLDEEQTAFLKEMLAYASEEHPTAVPLGMENDICPENWLIEGEPRHFDWY